MGEDASFFADAGATGTSALHPAAMNHRVIAVGVDGDGHLWAGSSNGFDPGQRAALSRLGITRVPGSSYLHAEEELLPQAAATRGLPGVPNLRRIGTSVRYPCGPLEHDCLGQLTNAGVGIEP